jgi:hypothetical protein
MSITPLARGATAEFVGTPFLVAALTGSGITAERLAGGNFAHVWYGKRSSRITSENPHHHNGSRDTKLFPDSIHDWQRNADTSQAS